MPLFGPPDVRKLKDRRDGNRLMQAVRYPKDAQIRREAAQALVDLGWSSLIVDATTGLSKELAVAPLLVALDDAKSCEGAARALGAIGDQQSVDLLGRVLGKYSAEATQAVADALVRMGQPAIGPLVAALDSKDASVRQVAADALDKLGYSPSDGISRARYWVARQDWAKCAGRSLTLEPLLVVAEDGKPDIRRNAIRCLAQIEDPRVVTALAKALCDQDESVCEEAARGLAKIGSEAAIAGLSNALRASSERRRQKLICSVLVSVGSPGMAALASALGSAASGLGTVIVEALGEVGSKQAADALLPALKSGETLVRLESVKVLEKIKGAAADPLVALLGDEDAAVRKATVQALDHLRWEPPAGAIGDAYWAVRNPWRKVTEIATLIGHEGPINAIRFSPSGKILASGSVDGTIRLWDVDGGRELVSLSDNDMGCVFAVDFSPEGDRIMSGSSDKLVRIWNIQGSQPDGPFGHPDQTRVHCVAYSPKPTEAAYAASGSSDGVLILWGYYNYRRLRGNGCVYSIAFSPDGRLLAASWNSDGIRLLDVNNGQIIWSLPDSRGIYDPAFSPDGSLLTGVQYRADCIYTYQWRLRDRVLVRELGLSYGRKNNVGVAFSPDGSILASSAKHGSVYLRQISDGEMLCELQGHTGDVRCLTFSPQGDLVASGGDDNTIRVWRKNP